MTLAQRIHFRGGDYEGQDTRAACGQRTIYRQTSVPSRVTCRRCQQSPAFREMQEA